MAYKKYWGTGNHFGRDRNGKTIPIDADSNFSEVWDKVISYLPNTNGGINVFQFLSLVSLMVNETGGWFRIVGEKGTLPYMFNANSSGKKSYNASSANESAYNLFNNSTFLESHKDLDRYAYVNNTGRFNTVWDGDVYPNGMPTNPEYAGIIAEADFYKFRGRGLIQTTFRANYKYIIEAILGYDGENQTIKNYGDLWANNFGLDTDLIATSTSNVDWDDLFFNTNLEIASIAIKLFHERRNNFLDIKMDSTNDKLVRNLLGTGPGSFYYVGYRTGGSDNYGQVVRARVLQMLNRLFIDANDPS